MYRIAVIMTGKNHILILCQFVLRMTSAERMLDEESEHDSTWIFWWRTEQAKQTVEDVFKLLN